jgi:methylaspartate ammonia-lyase
MEGQRNKKLEHGPVVFTKGRYKGKKGFYDDDAVTTGGNPCAIVYLGTPCASPFLRVRHDEVKNLRAEALVHG